MTAVKQPVSQKIEAPLRRSMLRKLIVGVLLPLALISIITALALPQIQQFIVAGQLRSVVAAREMQLNLWRHTLLSELNNLLLSDETFDKAAGFLEGASAQDFAADYSSLVERLKTVARENRNFDTFFLVNRDGRVVLSTDLSDQSGTVSDQEYYKTGLNNPIVQPPYFDLELQDTVIYAARPFYNAQGEIIGVFAGRANNGRLNQILSSPAEIGATGETYLVDADSILLTPNRPRVVGARIATLGAENAIERRLSGSASYAGYDGQDVLGAYHWLPDFRSGLLVEQQLAEIRTQAAPAAAVIIGLALAAAIVSYIVLRALSYQYAEPVFELAAVSQQITQGNLQARVGSRASLPEFWPVANDYNQMVDAVETTIAGLDQQLEYQNQQLEQRNELLSAYSAVSQTISSIMDPELLQDRLVELIRDYFDLYYVGLFILDEDGKWAELKAATGAGGQTMLAGQHRLAAAGDSMIGWAIANDIERIAHEAGDDPVRLATPELPLTRSEAALPMHSRGQVVGALSVQSTEPNAFEQHLVSVLKAMADQAAVALDNARLFEANRQALDNLNLAYGRLSLTGWQKLLRTPEGLAFAGTASGVEPVRPLWDQVSRTALKEHRIAFSEIADEDGLYPLAIPIRAGMILLGTLTTYKPATDGRWTGEEIDLLQSITDQLGLALESSRLYEESQRQAEHEQITGRVTANFRERLNVETILQTAALELRQALNLPEVTVRLASGQSEIASEG
jgi:GAF domain-containing protein